jgi:hypothetical protein
MTTPWVGFSLDLHAALAPVVVVSAYKLPAPAGAVSVQIISRDWKPSLLFFPRLGTFHGKFSKPWKNFCVSLSSP